MSRTARLAMIDRRHGALPVVRQCELLGVARSSLYYEPVPAHPADLDLMRRIDEQYLRTPFYGSRRMTAWLRRAGHEVGRKRVRRLMGLMGIEAIYQKPNTSWKHPENKIYPYLLRDLTIDRVNQVWCSDITYIPMAKGFLYLVAVMDWASRRVLSWRLSNTMDAEFCVDALEEALVRHGRPEIFNTDQGSQFTIHRPACGARRRHQHGRQGPVPRQHLHRAAVAQPQVRGGLHQGLRHGRRGARRDRWLSHLVQR
jgi:putative transposase